MIRNMKVSRGSLSMRDFCTVLRGKCSCLASDVDEAVRKKDPTGGRGLDGHIGEKLKEKKSPSGRCRQQPVEG